MGSISPPGVEVIQDFVTQSPSVSAPPLPSVAVGVAKQIVDAFDDNGNPQSSALAGTYRDGQGTIAYNLPSLVSEASLVGFEDTIRVFLDIGGSPTELRSVSDEQVLINDATGDFAYPANTLTDATQLFQQEGIEPGDVVRIEAPLDGPGFRGETLDIEITSVISDTELQLAASIIEENLAGLQYDIVRNPAQFVFDVATQANTEIGTDSDYFRATARTLKFDGVTPADYIGSAGDALTLVLTDSEHYVDGTRGAVGDSIFEDTGAPGDFTTSIPSTGSVPSTTTYLQFGAPAAGQVLREVLYVVDDERLVIESGEGTLTAQNWVVGEESATGSDGVTNGTSTFVSVSALFETTIQAAGAVPAGTFHIEIEGDGVYEVATVVSDTEITVTGTTGTATGQTYTVIETVSSGLGDGDTKADTVFLSVDGGLTGLVATQSVNVGGTEAAAIASVTDDFELALGGSLTDGADRTFSVVDTAASLSLSFDVDAEDILVQLARVAGISGNTHAEIVTAITSDADPAFNPVVSDIITAAAAGAGSFTEADLGSYAFDGGANEEQLLLDADLIGSATPTAQVYVSYRALRVDLSAASSDPQLIEIDNQDTRESLLGPATTENPLSLAVFFMLTNSPTNSVFALGVGAVTPTKPNGTLEAYNEALDFLEGQDVYSVVTLTQDLTVAQALETHVDAMSAPTEKSERIGWFNSPMPDFENALVVASGVAGNTGTIAGPTPGATEEFSTSVNLADAGVQAGDILVVTALADATTSPSSVDGTVGPLYGVALTGVKTGDDFVAEITGSELDTSATGAPANLTDWNTLVDVSWTIYRAGAAITQRGTQASVVASVGEGFANRRMFHVWPDEVTADIGGTAFIIPGFYAAAAWAAKRGTAAPQQGLSNSTIAGFTGVRNSNGYFSKSQLDLIAGGGTYITIQESQNQPLRCRHQLSTDVSSIEKQEQSITTAIDFLAKFLRAGLKKQVGTFNITQSYLDALATTVQGLLRSQIESGTVTSATLLSIAVDDVRPDKVNVKIEVDPPYPANLIEITIEI
jgi:hypothetical protein